MSKYNMTKTANPAAPAAPVKPALPKGMAHDKALLLAVFAIQNPSRNRACNDHAMDEITRLAPEGCTVVRNKGNLLIRKGPAEGVHPHFLSHMDQVHDYVPFMRVHVSGNVLHAVDGNDQRCGVGGDDKCGIYLALSMLHTLPHVTAVFVRDEEVGCLGSADVPLEWFANAAFVIQADRNNRTMDVIRETNGMICASDAFMAAILGLPIAMAAGHGPASGSVTDIGELSGRGLAVSMVNISSGYHNPHQRSEIVHLDELGIACQLAFEAAMLLGDAAWAHEPESQYFAPIGSPATRRVYGGSSWYHSGDDDHYWSSANKRIEAEVEADDWTPAGGTESCLEDEAEWDAKRRDDLIDALVAEHGWDRDFDVLDGHTTAELEDILDECDSAAVMARRK